jgi:hypothetical protein
LFIFIAQFIIGYTKLPSRESPGEFLGAAEARGAGMFLPGHTVRSAPRPEAALGLRTAGTPNLPT